MGRRRRELFLVLKRVFVSAGCVGVGRRRREFVLVVQRAFVSAGRVGVDRAWVAGGANVVSRKTCFQLDE